MSKFIDRTGEIGYNSQGEKMTIIRCSRLTGQNYVTIDIKFEDDVILYNKRYGTFKRGEIKHPIRYEESFAYHIEVELGIDLDDIWNWDKNNELGINPYEITKQSNRKVWIYCQKHDYHNYDRNGNKVGYEITCNNFYNNKRCSYCHNSKKVHYKDSLAYKYPQIANMIAIEKNNLTFEDCYNISCYSNKKFYFKCDKCNIISNKKYSLNQITSHGYSCRICNDGISVPEKFMNNILKQLDENYIYQLTNSEFNWCNKFCYDFYIFKYNMIIEINGLQHYEESNRGKSLFEEQMNDLFKYKCAKNHVDNYIVIDCRYSTLEWMKENIIKELSSYFDLSNIDWELAWKESQNSLCIKAWELWNNGVHSTIEIGRILKLNYATIRKYLKIGTECGKCDYTVELSRKSSYNKISGKNNCNSIKVLCITTGKIFDTMREGEKYYNICRGGVSACCKGKTKSAGKLKDGTRLKWKILEYLDNEREEII